MRKFSISLIMVMICVLVASNAYGEFSFAGIKSYHTKEQVKQLLTKATGESEFTEGDGTLADGSLSTIDRKKYKKLWKSGKLHKVLSGIDLFISLRGAGNIKDVGVSFNKKSGRVVMIMVNLHVEAGDKYLRALKKKYGSPVKTIDRDDPIMGDKNSLYKWQGKGETLYFLEYMTVRYFVYLYDKNI